MKVSAVTGVIIGLSVVAVGNHAALGQAPKPGQPAAREPGQPEAGRETPAKEVDRLVQGFRQHPVKRSAAGLGRIYATDLQTGAVVLAADPSDQVRVNCGSPTWSHDGRRILFDSFRPGAARMAHLQSVELVAGEPTVTDLGPGNCPTFAPDDRRIAFMRNAEVAPEGQGGVWMMRADGSGRHWLGAQGRPRWSPDVHQFMIIGFSTPCEVTVMDAKPEKSGVLRLAGNSLYAAPSWAGPGTVIALTGSEGDGDTLALIDVTKPAEGRIKETVWKNTARLDLRVTDPVYAASRGECLFIGADRDGMALYAVRKGQTGPPRRLEPDERDSQIWDLAVSPDGRYVLFGSDRPDRRRK